MHTLSIFLSRALLPTAQRTATRGRCTIPHPETTLLILKVTFHHHKKNSCSLPKFSRVCLLLHHGCETGKVILIRLPSNKQNELDSLAKEQHLCSISAVALENVGIKTSMQRLESLYKNLLEDCLPSWTQYAQMETEDLDWLMQRKNEDDVRTRKRQRSESSDSISFSRSSAWPRAEYLHEIGAYALPFTVPY